MRPITIINFATFLLIASSALAAESAYVPNQRFMPLAPRTAGTTIKPAIIAQPNKFLPLTQSRFPMPVRQINTAGSNNVVSEFPEKPVSDKKTSMSQEQAKQLLSIFAEAK